MPRKTTTMLLAVLVLALVAAAALMAGCGSTTTTAQTGTTTAPASTTTGSPTTSGDSTTTTAEATTTTGGAAPAGPGATAAVESTNGAYPTSDIPEWGKTATAMAFPNASYGVSSMMVVIANYEVTAATRAEYNKIPPLEPGQGIVELMFIRSVPNENEPPLVTGVYDFSKPQGQAELTGEAKVRVEGGKAVQMSRDSLQGTVEITSVTDTAISGTFSLKDKWTTMEGTFTAPVKK